MTPTPELPRFACTPMEAQRAHDMLINILETPELLAVLIGDDEKAELTRKCMVAVTDTLCWLLGHEHNGNFIDNLKQIEAYLAREGYEFRTFGGGGEPHSN